MHTSRFRQALHTAVYLERFLRSGQEQDAESIVMFTPSFPSFNHLAPRNQQGLHHLPYLPTHVIPYIKQASFLGFPSSLAVAP
jgi:hypothetical protein